MIFIFLFIGTLVNACHPQCRWACDDPVCNATCAPSCLEPACQIFNASNLVCVTVVPQCSIICAPDQCESDTCPACEVQCQPPPSICGDGTILCEAPSCAWQCTKPNCRLPICELQCEHPACEAISSAATISIAAMATLIFVFMIM